MTRKVSAESIAYFHMAEVRDVELNVEQKQLFNEMSWM